RKDSTSAAAAKRAEELRALEESRTEERASLDQREERRRRREAGLPELTRSERLRAGLSSFGSRIAQPRYLVALFVVVVLVAGGVAYLVTQGSDSANGKGGKAKSAKTTTPAEIEVTVLNGTAVPGLAAEFGDKVEGKGFQLGAVTNSSTSFADSVVMFERGHAPEARKVAKLLDISEVRLMTSDIESVSGGAPVSVIVGEDNAAAEG
ncbi:MAG TPA: LytR C-terminal domain-containing protein, partial [Solirubrobacterales bacterium]|nr:LytR C-terminal domain-containing protein [Solirubrobacterales bacterium]